MSTPAHEIDVLATACAAQLLNGLRLKHSAEIPLAVWKMMAAAEARLNADLERYFRAPEIKTVSRRPDSHVGSHEQEAA